MREFLSAGVYEARERVDGRRKTEGGGELITMKNKRKGA